MHRLAADERHATAALIGSLAELDARRLYLGEGCSSLFTYCTQVLHLSEHAAYGRIEAARATRRFPMVLERLAEGALTLTAVGLLAPHLTMDNHRELLDAARHKTKREVEQIVATLCPRPAVPSSVRKLPSSPAQLPAARPTASAEAAIAPPTPSLQESETRRRPAALLGRAPSVEPLAPERYKVQFTLDGANMALLRRAQALMRHRVPDGDVGAVFTLALTALVEAVEKTRLAATARPRTSSRASKNDSRAIPAAVRREVWARDEGRCAFVGTRGRCTETGFLEFHHVHPYAAGGEPVAANTELRCRSHNQYEAELFFGVMEPPAARERAAGWELSDSVWTELARANTEGGHVRKTPDEQLSSLTPPLNHRCRDHPPRRSSRSMSSRNGPTSSLLSNVTNFRDFTGLPSRIETTHSSVVSSDRTFRL